MQIAVASWLLFFNCGGAYTTDMGGGGGGILALKGQIDARRRERGEGGRELSTTMIQEVE